MSNEIPFASVLYTGQTELFNQPQGRTTAEKRESSTHIPSLIVCGMNASRYAVGTAYNDRFEWIEKTAGEGMIGRLGLRKEVGDEAR